MKKEMDKIADYLLLRSSYMQELGLFHGKMGVVVALYLYADAYGDEVMREYAWELFQQVYDGVHTDMPVGLERGLAGIGYGTTLLCKRGLVECSLNDILEDIDRKIMERDPRRLTDMSVRSGVRGLMLYLDLRQSVEAVATFDSTLVATVLDLTVGGMAQVTARMDVKDLKMELTGKSTATLTGAVRYLSLFVSTGKLEAAGLEVMAAEANVTSSGVAALWVTDRFQGKTSTGGKITYKGAPPIVRSGAKFMGGDITRVE